MPVCVLGLGASAAAGPLSAGTRLVPNTSAASGAAVMSGMSLGKRWDPLRKVLHHMEIDRLN